MHAGMYEYMNAGMFEYMSVCMQCSYMHSYMYSACMNTAYKDAH